MPLENIDKLFRELSELDYLDETIEIRWHAGEPLAMPIEFYYEAIEIINHHLKETYSIKFSVQTNAIPLTEEWCNLLKKNNFEVGISIDGPQHIHDLNRVTRKGRGTFYKTLEKVSLIKDHSIPFGIIAVLTNYSLDYPDEIFHFFSKIGASSIGFNIEETEGENLSRSLESADYLERYHSFMKRLFYLNKEHKIRLREFDQIESWIKYGEGDRPNFMIMPLKILCMDWSGNLSTFSPELLSYPRYIFSNINSGGLKAVLSKHNFQSTLNEIKMGVRKCKSECPYFQVCGGGAPSNKLWENGTFNSTSTSYCTARFKIITDIILEHFENQKMVQKAM
jgi:uncharacterized protein